MNNLLTSIQYKQEIATFILAIFILHIIEILVAKKYKVLDYFWYRECIIFILAIYFTGVCHFTILHRDVTAGMKYELSLFWSYRYVFEHNSKSFFFEVFYNIILLLPLGMMIPLYLKPFQKFRHTAFAGLVISCTIEISQLIFHIGLFEFDDIFNNTLGACIGYSIFYMSVCMVSNSISRDKYIKLILLLLIDACVIGYFGRLWLVIV